MCINNEDKDLGVSGTTVVNNIHITTSSIQSSAAAIQYLVLYHTSFIHFATVLLTERLRCSELTCFAECFSSLWYGRSQNTSMPPHQLAYEGSGAVSRLGARMFCILDKSRGTRDNVVQLRHVEPARVPLRHAAPSPRVHHSFLTRCIGWRKNNRTLHPISYLDTLTKTREVRA